MTFTLYPAIDLKDGQCVRLLMGEMDQATVFSDSPAAQAKSFRDGRLHPSSCGGPERRLRGQGREPRGGGGDPESHRCAGAARRRHPHARADRCLAGGRHFPRHPRHRCPARPGAGARKPPAPCPARIAVGIDAKNGKVAVEGWAEDLRDRRDRPRPKKFEGAGVAAIIYTDIDRDGILTGINWESTLALADAVSIPVIASGGRASIADMRAHDHAATPKSSKARSPAARSMTGESIRKRLWRF
jgi:phosphoribosylformimino-5-aminoimidazole carboxamide ribotide isomerase